MREQTKLEDLTKKIDTIMKKGKNVLKKADQEQEISEGHFMNLPLSIVFVGQYSAGKSSILKALTGIDDIKIGAGITTQNVRTF